MAVEREMVTGVTAGVPFVAIPPSAGPRPDAPVVLAWHLLDPPRTEAAFAAALPLDGLDAWRFYLGLPLSGSRLPAGGMDELMRLGYEDAVLNLYGPISEQAVAEAAPAYAELRARFGLGDGPLGLLGGSQGAAVAGLVLAEGVLDARAAVLVSPLIRLRPVVEAVGRQYGVDYRWSQHSLAAAARMDLVARADEVARNGPAVLAVVGEQDDVDGFRRPAEELVRALGPGRSSLVLIPDMAHALADEPGIEPAPQTEHAEAVDRHAVRWLHQHLGGPAGG
ncbi:MAG: alpha/beta hydrolase [Pseudonocardiales bacterium]|nr:alpha/beta hydrolase [Pseudonocardiales bacterium]